MIYNDFKFSLQLGGRLTQVEVDFLNEHLSDLLPEVNGKEIDFDKELTMRMVLLDWANRLINKAAANKKSLPADIETIKTLEKLVFELTETVNSLQETANSENPELSLLQKRVNELIEANRKYHETNQELVENNQALQLQNLELQQGVETTTSKVKEYTDNPRRIIIDLTKGQYVVTEAIRQRVEKDTRQPLGTGQMLFDLFWRYVRERKTQIAFPFYFTKDQIDKIVKDNQE